MTVETLNIQLPVHRNLEERISGYGPRMLRNHHWHVGTDRVGKLGMEQRVPGS